MKAIKNNLLSMSSVLMLLLITVSGVIINNLNSIEITRQITLIVINVLVIIGMYFVKEEHLHKASTAVYLSVFLILCLQIIIGEETNYVTMRYLYLFDVITLYTAALLPLTYIQSAKLISKYSNISFERLIAISFVMLVPIIFVLGQINLEPVVVALLVCYITMIVMRKEHRIKIFWCTFLIPFIFIISDILLKIQNPSRIGVKLETIITRGQNDPSGFGWVRTVLDGLFTQTPLIGATNYSTKNYPVVEMILNWGDHNIAALLTEYGWLVFLITLAVYALFFICVFRMVHKTKQSSFAKYTSLMFALSLLIQALYSLIGLFLLDSAPMDMPFISSSYTINIVNYLSFGVIFSLYMKRNSVSVLEENKTADYIEDFSVKDAIKDLMNKFIGE